MVRNTEKYDLATHYRQRGFSYTEIAKIVGVSKSTVSVWLAKKAFSKRVRSENVVRAGRENAKRLALLHKAKTKERERRYAESLKTATTEYRHYKANPLFIAGLVLYMAPGGHTQSGPIRITSSQIESHRIFQKFARQFLGIERTQVKFWLLLYPDLSETTCVREWTKGLKLKPEQWYKNQTVKSRSSKPALHFGVGNTIIGGTVLKRRLDLWVKLATIELQK